MQSGMIKENIDLGLVLGPLPVEWGKVFVEKTDEGHNVRWSTLQEVNSSYFVVERKFEGQKNLQQFHQRFLQEAIARKKLVYIS